MDFASLSLSDVKAVRKASAQHDLFNRLHSIAADERFVRTVSQDWYGGRFEVVANQRCGTWYCDPSSSSSIYAYFKSTDGHTNNWNFNLRRSNLPFAKCAEEKGGVILVDSTRRGKRMPDALSKTVPIWCAVINLALKQQRVAALSDNTSSAAEWDTNLYLPPSVVSPSERAQIERLIPGWADSLRTSALSLPDLKKPLRPFFIHPATSTPPHIPDDPPFIPIICLSASRWVGSGSMDEIPSVTRLPKRTMGFEYVQGAGDDDELWGRGLKPVVFHANKAELLASDRDELPHLVDELVSARGRTAPGGTDSQPSNSRLLVPVLASSSRLRLDIGPPIGSSTTAAPPPDGGSEIHTIRVTEVEKMRGETVFHLPYGASTTVFRCPSAKADPKTYGKALESLVAFCKSKAGGNTILVLSPGHADDFAAAQALRAAKQQFEAPEPLPPVEASPDRRKVILPLAQLLVLAVPDLGALETPADEDVSKKEIAEVLQGLVSLWPDGNPPRAALKRVNEALMTE